MKIGDLVRLKSGGPTMVVESVGRTNPESIVCSCTWFQREGDAEGYNKDSGWSKCLSVTFDARILVLDEES